MKNKFFIIQEYKYTITNFKNASYSTNYAGSTYTPSSAAVVSLTFTPNIPSGYTTAYYCIGQSWDDGFVVTIVPPEYNDTSGHNYVIIIKHNYNVNNNSTFQFTFRIVYTKSDMTSITTATGIVSA